MAAREGARAYPMVAARAGVAGHPAQAMVVGHKEGAELGGALGALAAVVVQKVGLAGRAGQVGGGGGGGG